MRNKPVSGKGLKSWLARLFGYAPPQPQVNDTRKQKSADQLLSLSAYEDRPNPHEDSHHVPPLPAVLIAPDTALTLLQSYGLDVVLTPEDDATLWAAVISVYWPLPHAGKIYVEGLRFGVGAFDDQTTMKLQPIAGWCFERADEKTLKTTLCHDKDIDGQHDSKLRALPNRTLFDVAFLPSDDYPNMAIVVERPSVGKQEVIVYDGAQLGWMWGVGKTEVYSRVVGGWQESGRSLARWIS